MSTQEQMTKTFCPECGFGVQVDDDGCCVTCGATATGPAVDALNLVSDQGGPPPQPERDREAMKKFAMFMLQSDLYVSIEVVKDGVDAILGGPEDE